jgi:hypothetical protein
MVEIKNKYSILVENLKGEGHFPNPGVDQEVSGE